MRQDFAEKTRGVRQDQVEVLRLTGPQQEVGPQGHEVGPQGRRKSAHGFTPGGAQLRARTFAIEELFILFRGARLAH